MQGVFFTRKEYNENMNIKAPFYRVFQFVFNYGARVLPWRKAVPVIGQGSIKRIPELLKKEKVSRPLVVTDPGLMKAGVSGMVLDVLKNAGIKYDLFDQVEPNPSTDTVDSIQKIFFEKNCDSFVAIGGGSAMDAAKAAGARVVFPNRTVGQMGGLLKVWKKIPPFIAVPTTSGTGSETTIAALVTDSKTHHKYALMDLHLIPKYAVLDPDLTKGLPPQIIGPTGMDALTHAVEAYLCWTYNTRESKAFALDAIKLIFENLEKAYNDGNDMDARLNMMIASYKAGFAFTRAGVGNIHAIAHTLGGLYSTPHGLANAVIMPIVLEDYGSKVKKKLAIMAEAAGLGSRQGSETFDSELADIFVESIQNMNRRMNIPDHFDYIKEEDVPQMIRWALKEANPVYPVPVVYDKTRAAAVIRKVEGKLAIL